MIKVYKVGGSLLKDEESRQKIYQLLENKILNNHKIVLIVSAIGRESDPYSTDQLLSFSQFLTAKEKDCLVSIGEIFSSLFITNELKGRGFNVALVSYKENGIKCDNSYGNANILSLDSKILSKKLLESDLIVVPGFIGESDENEVITLGRGGSDLSAVLIASFLGLDEVYLMKQVDGIYKEDPLVKKEAQRYQMLTYDEAIKIACEGGKVIQEKAVRYAKKKKIIIKVGDISENKFSTIK